MFLIVLSRSLAAAGHSTAAINSQRPPRRLTRVLGVCVVGWVHKGGLGPSARTLAFVHSQSASIPFHSILLHSIPFHISHTATEVVTIIISSSNTIAPTTPHIRDVSPLGEAATCIRLCFDLSRCPSTRDERPSRKPELGLIYIPWFDLAGLTGLYGPSKRRERRLLERALAWVLACF